STWARVVDYSAWPPMPPGVHLLPVLLPKEPETGAFLVLGALKKAWLQSSPWLLVALLGLGRAAFRKGEARALALPILGVLGLFPFYGFRRIDGWCFNQRYLLELMPLAAVALAWALDGLELRWLAALAGAALAWLLLHFVMQRSPFAPARQLV